MASELDEIVDRAELGNAAAACRAAVVAAIVEHADDAHVGIALCGERGDELFAAAVRPDHDRAAIEATLPRPPAHQQEQRAAKCDQREQPDHIIGAEPGPREFVARSRKVGNSHGEQKYYRPRRGEAHVLFLMAAEGLDLINIGGLERQQREQRNADDAADVVVGGVRKTRNGPKKERKADCRDQKDFDHADDAGKNDRRVGLLKSLRRDRKRGGRKRARCRCFRGGARQRLYRRRHRRSRLEYRALFGTRHSC